MVKGATNSARLRSRAAGLSFDALTLLRLGSIPRNVPALRGFTLPSGYAAEAVFMHIRPRPNLHFLRFYHNTILSPSVAPPRRLLSAFGQSPPRILTVYYTDNAYDMNQVRNLLHYG